jgi:hypothetical protein
LRPFSIAVAAVLALWREVARRDKEAAGVTITSPQVQVVATPALPPESDRLSAPRVPLASQPKVFTNERVRLSDLVDEITFVIKGKTYEDCDILGPAVVALSGVGTMDHVRFVTDDLDEVLWEVEPENARRLGVIGLDSCVFRRCRFIAVGVAGTPELTERLRKEFES